jgi:hypothetical protein
MDTATTTKGRVTPWNKGTLQGRSAPSEVERDLGHPDSTAARSSDPRTRIVQPRHRQQAARVRSGRASRPRCHARQSGCAAGDCHAKEDSAPGPVRDHQANTGRGRRLDHGGPSEAGAVPVSEPCCGVASSFDPAVFPDRRVLGGSIGLDPAAYGTHSLRRTKPTLIYRRTRNLRAVQLLLGHSKLESTVRYLGIEVDDALEIAEQTEV